MHTQTNLNNNKEKSKKIQSCWELCVKSKRVLVVDWSIYIYLEFVNIYE